MGKELLMSIKLISTQLKMNVLVTQLVWQKIIDIISNCILEKENGTLMLEELNIDFII